MDAIPRGQIRVAHNPPKGTDFFFVLWAEFVAVMVRSAREVVLFSRSRVPLVFKVCEVLQVFWAIVCLVEVFVVDGEAARADERRRHQTMNLECFWRTVFEKCHAQISISILAQSKDFFGHCSNVLVAAGCHARKRLQSSAGADLVKTFIADDIFPLFHGDWFTFSGDAGQ